VFGCGSLGAPIAFNLAAAGVGRFVLVDPQALTGPNTSRHELGIAYMGQNKAAGLREALLRKYPHLISVTHHAATWQEALARIENLFSDADLVVVAIGNWHAEAQFNDWHLRCGRAPVATDPTWDQFLEAKIPDPELRNWLPKLAGHALTGERDQDIMGNPNGPTRSGKTTFCGALREAMGDYAVEVDANLFMLSSHGLNHNGEPNQPVLATLKGIRLVVSAEANDTMRLDEAKVKKITGNDSITAAAKYKNPVTFVPNFLWLLHGNERVRVTVGDDAIWRRIKQIPFKESTAEAEVKEEIRNRLLTDQVCHNAVLRWAVDGLRRFQADGGLKPFPKAVEMETNEYRAAMNPLADFVRDYCVLEKNAEVLAANLRGKYIWWCDEQNLRIRDRLGDNEIAKHLKRLNCEQAKERGGDRRRTWVGIRLKEGQS